MIISRVQLLELNKLKRLDPEFYNPKFLKLEESLNGAFSLGDVANLKLGTSLINFNNKDCRAYYLRTGDFKEYRIDFSNVMRVPDDLLGVEVQDKDIIITRKGQVGQVWLVDSSKKKIFISSEIIRIRVKEPEVISPYYLAAYLASLLAQDQIKRLESGMSIMSISKSDLSDVKIKKLKNYEEITKTYKNAEKYISNFYEFNKKADSLLQSSIEYRKNKNYSKQGFSIKISQVKKNNNLDVFSYLPKNELINCINLNKIAHIKSGAEVGVKSYQKSGIKFLRVGNITKYGLINKAQKYIGKEVYNKFKSRYKPNKGDILLTKDGTPGIALVYDYDEDSIISGGIVRLIIQNKDYNPYYIANYINSFLGQENISSFIAGSNIRHLKIKDIETLKIPVITKDCRNKIGQLAQAAINYKKQGVDIKNKAISYINEKY